MLCLSSLLSGIVSSGAFAAEMKGHDMSMPMDGKTSASAAANPSTNAFKAADMTMHKNMSIRYSGDTDTDFVRGMIPHHQGAIDMAKVELQYGKDPELKKMAEDIISAQEKEISEMQAWLKAHGK